MPADRAIYHVVPDAGAQRWLVTREDSEFREDFRTKEEALQRAKDCAHRAPLGQVKVHRHDGNMEYEHTYGEDPPSSPG